MCSLLLGKRLLLFAIECDVLVFGTYFLFSEDLFLSCLSLKYFIYKQKASLILLWTMLAARNIVCKYARKFNRFSARLANVLMLEICRHRCCFM